ncbi:MAG TPA: hypothetical protein VG188_08495 [Solirubrobacteraceae bacterium]|nr:hypothetical protein [Solirubrobacteraceae bacterium]
MNLRAGDIPRFINHGSEVVAPESGRLALEEIRCIGSVNPAGRIARIESAEFASGRASHGKIIKSAVDVWPAPGFVAINNSPHRKSRSRLCIARFLEALHRRVNLQRKGQMQIGPFTVSVVPNSVPGAANGYLAKVNETRLFRTGAVRTRIYRDILGFTTGPAELELEAIGFGRPVAASTEAEALRLLLARANAHAVRSAAP